MAQSSVASYLERMPGHSYKGQSGGTGTLSLWQNPTASSLVSQTIAWSVSSGNPANWQVWQANVAGTIYTLAATVAPTLRMKNGLASGRLAYVIGVNADGSPATKPSNTVTIHT